MEFNNYWKPKLNSFFEVWEKAKGNIENYLYFKAAFDQFKKIRN